jgi:hypothetical protein
MTLYDVDSLFDVIEPIDNSQSALPRAAIQVRTRMGHQPSLQETVTFRRPYLVRNNVAVL